MRPSRQRRAADAQRASIVQKAAPRTQRLKHVKQKGLVHEVARWPGLPAAPAGLSAVGAFHRRAISASSQTSPTHRRLPNACAQRQGHLLPLHRRERPDHHPTTGQSAAGRNARPTVAAPTATDAERQAVTFTAFDLDVHLRPAEHHIAVRARLTVRNDGKSPLARIPLQISSSLNWERIRILAAHDVAFQVATLNSDADHTGQLHEAAVPLATPLAPGATLQLDVTYSGTIAQSAQRLLAIGTPEDVALHSDWDTIGVAFTGLRGFGNVVWYPVSSVPVILGDGARVFDEMGEHKLRTRRRQLPACASPSNFPTASRPPSRSSTAIPPPLTVTDSATAEVAGVATAKPRHSTLGFEAPSLFVAIRTPHQATNTTALDPARQRQPPSLLGPAAATVVTPFLQGWLGQRPRSQLTLLDLPDPDDAPFETGALLATSIRHDAPPSSSTGIMAHALTHAWMQSPRAWLSEGVAHFMGTLWVEKRAGPRTSALEALESGRIALALAEPASPGAALRPAPRPGQLARLLPHQGRLCLLDAPRHRRRRCALRRSPRL